LIRLIEQFKYEQKANKEQESILELIESENSISNSSISLQNVGEHSSNFSISREKKI
jgi:hypothetical protein